HGRHGGRVDLVGGFRAGGAHLDGVTREVAQPAGGHLGTAGVVHAHEQDARLVRHGCLFHGSVGCGTTTSSAACPACGYSTASRPMPARRPASCAATNAGTEAGTMPANVSVNARPTVTAGLANEVDEVNQYAAPM